MMDKRQALQEILLLARAAHHKKVSELSSLEKHAVAFTCSYFPVSIVNGKLKYTRAAKQTDLSVEFVLINSMITKLGVEAKKFTSASVHVWPDEGLPKFEPAPYQVALEAYPDKLMIPLSKTDAYIHLPTIKFPINSVDKEEILSVVMTELIQLEAYARNPSIQVLRKHKILVKALLSHIDSARKIEKFFNLNFLSWISTQTWKAIPVDYTGVYDADNYHNQSYLAAFIYEQSKGIYLAY